MIAAWGIVIPLGMSIALMCKSVCPGKAYVYVSQCCSVHDRDGPHDT